MFSLTHLFAVLLFAFYCNGEIVQVGQPNVDVQKHVVQMVQSSSTLELGMRPDTNSSFEEFNINNGRCMYKNGNIIEGSASRPATEAEVQKLHEFKQQLADYGGVLQRHMSVYLTQMLQNHTHEAQPKGDNWPMAPTPPCFCTKCFD